jgi:hypothetical protein
MFSFTHVFDLTNLKGEKRRNVRKLNNELDIVNQLVDCALYRHYRWMRAWTLLVIKTRQLLSERESQSAMIICRVCARWFLQFPVMFTNNKKWRSTSWLTMSNSLFSFRTFLLFSPFRLVRSNTWVNENIWNHPAIVSIEGAVLF